MIGRVLTATALTLRIHRFEAAFAIVVLGSFSLALVACIVRVGVVQVPEACAIRATRDLACDLALQAWYDATGGSNLVRGVAPIIVGLGTALVLGVPLVAREVETGSALLAWSLSARRRRWLLHRMLPMLAILIVGMSVVALLGDQLRQLLDLRLDEPPRMGDLRSDPFILVAAVFMGFGLALLAGALAGRLFPAFLLAAVLFVPFVLGPQFVRSYVAMHMTRAWSEPYDAATETFVESAEAIRVYSTWYEVDGERYRQLRPAQKNAPDGAELEAWTEANVTRTRVVVPKSVMDALWWAEIVGSLGIGLLALALTDIAVSRRRPL
jgi:hypothetical protein